MEMKNRQKEKTIRKKDREKEKEIKQKREIKYERGTTGWRKSEDKGRKRMRKRDEGEKLKEIYKVRE